MSLHDISSSYGLGLGRRRSAFAPLSRAAPTRRHRHAVDWRTVGLVALSAILLIAMMARS